MPVGRPGALHLRYVLLNVIVYVNEVPAGAVVVTPGRKRPLYRAGSVNDAHVWVDNHPEHELGGEQSQLEPALQPEGPETLQQRARRVVRDRLRAKEAS